MNIGFIGLGQMGKRMAQRVLVAGYDLTVHDLRKEPAQELLEKGAKWVDTPEDMAKSCQVVLSSLPGPPDVEEVVYCANGLMAGWKKGDIFVDMSTNSPSSIRRVAEDAKTKGIDVIDAPVSGGVRSAEQGLLTIIVGGNGSSLEKVRKVLETMGNKIFHVGDVGCGNIAKLVNNMIAATCTAINAESFVMGAKAGIDVKILWEVVRASTGNNWVLENSFPQAVFRGDFKPGFRVSLALKDIDLALALGREYGVPQPVGATVEQRYLEAKAAGLGDRSTQALILCLEKLAKVKVHSPE